MFWQLEWEDVQRVAHRKWEREQGRKDVTDDMSEDLSEGEKGDVIGEPVKLDSPRKHLDRNFSHVEVWSDSNKEKKLYIVLIRCETIISSNKLLLMHFLYLKLIVSSHFLIQVPILFSLHGLVRGENMELGRDSDTGGQVVYHVTDFRFFSFLLKYSRLLKMECTFCPYSTTEAALNRVHS